MYQRKIFSNVLLSSIIFGTFWKLSFLWPLARAVFGKSSENGRKSSGNGQKHCHWYVHASLGLYIVCARDVIQFSNPDLRNIKGRSFFCNTNGRLMATSIFRSMAVKTQLVQESLTLIFQMQDCEIVREVLQVMPNAGEMYIIGLLRSRGMEIQRSLRRVWTKRKT